ncbi:MAG: VOC family protein [Candidatus Aminicenantes bacterium]
MVHRCHHIGLLTENCQLLIDFYTKMLGFKEMETKSIPEEVMKKIFEIPSSCRLTKLKLGEIVLEVISPHNQKLKPRISEAWGYNHWGLAVRDKSEYFEELKAKGVHTVEIERERGSICFIRDPEGNLIEIYEA